MTLRIAALLTCGAFIFPGAAAASTVSTGLDVLSASGFAALSGKKIGVLCNHTAVDSSGTALADLLIDKSSSSLLAIFSPEHGFSGSAGHGTSISDSSYRGVPVHSLYGSSMRPSSSALAGLDALVFDIQDAGVRFYTYTATMALAQEEADKAGIEFIVLDRPNPITGDIIEGALLDEGVSALTAYLRVPLRHGMTPGELALLHAKTKKLRRKPTVIKMLGWERAMWQGQTGLAWLPPSPNLKTPLSAELYPGIACFEASNLSVGRGTETPFEWFGAPWLNPEAILAGLSASPVEGAALSSETRTPSDDKYAGEACRGLKVSVTDRQAFRPVRLFVRLFFALRKTHPEKFRPECRGLERMTGVRDFCGWLASGATEKQVLSRFERDSKKFLDSRKKFLLYR